MKNEKKSSRDPQVKSNIEQKNQKLKTETRKIKENS